MATPTRQMSRPQVRPMQPFRQQQSQALRPAVQQPMQQPMQRAMQQPMQQAQTMQQPMQQRSQPMQQKSPMVQRPQAMQPTPTRVQQPMQRSQLNAPAVMPREIPTPPGGGGVMRMPETGGLEPNLGGNELASTGQRGMPKYDPRGMGGDRLTTGMGMSEDMLSQVGGGGVTTQQPIQDPAYAAYAAEKQRQLDAGRAQREGALFNPPPPQKPVLQPGEVDMPIGHAGIGFGQDSALARDNPQFGMPPSMPPEMNQLHRTQAFKRGGKVTAVKKYAKGGTVKSTPVKASSRGDGIAQRGKTKGKIY